MKRKNFSYKIVILLLSIVVLNGCVKNNPIPVFLEIDEWKLEANPLLNGKEGELFHNFKHAAVYVGDEILGYFELPCKIPVLKFDKQRITVSPAIEDGGRGKVKIVYPFTEYFYEDADLVSGETYHISPVTRYNAAVDFDFVEDFESASLKFVTDPSSTASIFQTPHNEPGKSGYKGLINLSETDTLWLGNSTADMVLPKGGEPVYLEVDYRSTAHISAGMLSINSLNQNTIHPNIRMNKQNPGETVWKKIYIDFTEIVSYSEDSQYFEIYLRTVLPPELTTATVEIDNIKVIHF